MRPNRRGSKRNEPGSDSHALRVFLGTEEVCSVSHAKIPTEKRPVLELNNAQQQLQFVDSAGTARSFDISSVFDEGGRFLHMSVRVSEAFAVQADCVITNSKEENPRKAFKSGGKGSRFLPFFLPESPAKPQDLVGKGLFYRGLHFSGTITPGNVSALCLCDECRKSFRLQSFHAGFSDLAYFNCSDGPHTLVVSSDAPDAPPILGKADPDAVARFEAALPQCTECGGSFRYMNPLRCPWCRAPFIDFQRHPLEREREYYGNYLYGGSTQRLAPEP